jgi:hypothetical protein
MKYLKRLKNELLELTEKLTVKGPLPEYVDLRKVVRKDAVECIIALIKLARSIDQETDNWSPEVSYEWSAYLTNLKHWLGQVPHPPKSVKKDRAAA